MEWRRRRERAPRHCRTTSVKMIKPQRRVLDRFSWRGQAGARASRSTKRAPAAHRHRRYRNPRGVMLGFLISGQGVSSTRRVRAMRRGSTEVPRPAAVSISISSSIRTLADHGRAISRGLGRTETASTRNTPSSRRVSEFRLGQKTTSHPRSCSARARFTRLRSAIDRLRAIEGVHSLHRLR
jgi:hypothetical protein